MSNAVCVPDDYALLSVWGLSFVCEQYGVVRNDRVQGWQNPP